MQNTTERSSRSAEGLYKFFIYFVLVLLAVIIIVPVAWVFMASIKQNAESTATRGRCLPGSTGRTLSMRGTEPRWASICSTRSS